MVSVNFSTELVFQCSDKNHFVLNQKDFKHMLGTKQEKMQVVGTIWTCKGKKTLKGFFDEALNSALNTL